MPTLPTLTIDDPAVMGRVLKAFNNDPAAYKEWLKQAIKDFVRVKEEQVAREQTANDVVL